MLKLKVSTELAFLRSMAHRSPGAQDLVGLIEQGGVTPQLAMRLMVAALDVMATNAVEAFSMCPKSVMEKYIAACHKGHGCKTCCDVGFKELGERQIEICGCAAGERFRAANHYDLI